MLLLCLFSVFSLSLATVQQLPFEAAETSRRHRWTCVGPFPTGTREETALPESDVLFSRSHAPSTLVDSGWVSPTVFEEDDDGQVTIVYPEARWNYTRSYAGWSGLQYEAFCRRNVTFAHEGVYRLALEGAQEFAITRPAGPPCRKSLEWYSGDIYRLQKAPHLLRRMAAGSHEVTVRFAYDARVFGDPHDKPPAGTWAFRTLASPTTRPVFRVVRKPTLSKRGRPLGLYVSIAVSNPLDRPVCFTEALVNGVPVHLLEERMLCVESLQLRNVVVELNPEQKLSEQSLVVLTADEAKYTVKLDLEKQKDDFELFISTFRSSAGSISYAMYLPPTSKSKHSKHVQVALHGAGVDPETNPFWTSSLPARAKEWTVFPLGLTEWGWDWRGTSMRDVELAIENVAVVKQLWSKATDRRVSAEEEGVGKLVVVGHSNGGQGAWHFIERHPDQVVGAVPAAAYVKIQDYMPYHLTQAQHYRDPALNGILMTSLASFDNDLYASNVAKMPIIIRHGSEDDDVPAYHSKVLLTAIDKWANGRSNTRFMVEPGAKHWFDNVFKTPQVLEFIDECFKKADGPRLPASELPFTFTLSTANPDETQSMYGFRILQVATPGRLARLEITVMKDEIGESNFVWVTSENVRLISVDEQLAQGAFGRFKLSLDEGISLVNSEDVHGTTDWRRYGPMYSILNTNETLVLAVGTLGSADETDDLRYAARRIAHACLLFGQLDVQIVNDTQVATNDHAHLVLLGDPFTNAVVRELSTEWPTPVHFDGKGVFRIADSETMSGGLAFLTRHPQRRDGLIMVIAASRQDDIDRAVRFFPSRTGYLLPEWMSDIKISSSNFHQRATRLFDEWEKKEDDASPLEQVDSILIVAGNSDEDNPYRKGSAVQTHLLGYEFPNTLMLLRDRKVWFVTSSSKAKLLAPLTTFPTGNHVEIELLTRSKDEAENKAHFQKVLDAIGDGKLGVLPKDKMTGKFVDEWNAFVKSSDKDIKEVDVAPGVSSLLAVKDEQELKSEQYACKMSTILMSQFSEMMADAIDSGRKVTHEQLAEEVEKKLEDNKFWKQHKVEGLETGFGDWCYSPIIQSGGNYDLKSSAQSDDQRLKPGVIFCSLGIRYKSYCSNVGRTFLIDPDNEQEKNYFYLIELQKFALSLLKDGAECKEVYESIRSKIESERSDLLPYFTKTAGYATGIEFRDINYAISAKCQRHLKEDMVLALTLGFNGIPGPKNAYALSVIDTVKVGVDGAKLISDGLKKKDEVMFYLDEPTQKPKAKKSNESSSRATNSTAIVKTKLRNEGREIDMKEVERRREHQRELAKRRQEEGLARFSDGGGGTAGAREKQWRRFESYAQPSQLPEQVQNQKIFVDMKRATIVLPINGFAVPFHIHTLKSLIKQEEGDYTVLRFMFTTPGAITGKKEDTPFEDPSATFIRGLTYRSLDSFRFTELHREINDLKKAITKREAERREMEDVVEQDSLREIKGKRPIKLTDVQVRPSFDGKRQAGDVEIHTNGIRYQSTLKSEQKIDILFSNMKHLFFQPCDNELIVLVHVHLKTPIMIGKKKAKDVQFFREVSDASFDETGNKKKKRNYHDEDELLAEQEERKRRHDLNRYFKAFADKVAEASEGRVEVDVPFRELGFQGVPHRANVLMQPTTDCLVYLTEPPFMVLTLSEIEIAHLERVQFGLKNFDLVFVFQDFTRPPVHVNTIPTNQLDSVKEWLDSVDVPFSEGPVNLNWGAIMKTVNEDPYEFFKEGGWEFLSTGEGADGDADSDDSESGSEFEASSDALEEEEDEDSDGSDFSGEDSDSESGSAVSEDDEDGETWSDMEERTLQKEKAKGGSKYDSDDGGKKSKKSTNGHKR